MPGRAGQPACCGAVPEAGPDRWNPFDQGDAVIVGQELLRERLLLGLHEQAVRTLTFLKKRNLHLPH